MVLSEQMIGYLEVSLACMKKDARRDSGFSNKEVHDAIPQVERIIEMCKRENDWEKEGYTI